MWSRELCFFGRWDLRGKERAVTVNSGSYVKARFSGSSLTVSFDLSLNRPHCECTKEGSYPTIAWQMDGGEWHEAELAASVTLAEGLGKGAHTVMLMVRGLDEHQSRWSPPLVASVTFTGFVTEKLERALPQWRKPKLTMEFLGDSITEGVIVNEGRAGVLPGIPFTWPWLADARQSYAAQTALALGAEWRQVGFGATGLKRVGSGGAPGALDAFDFVYAGCPRDRWQPDIVVINQGTNESSMPPVDYQRLYAQYLAQIRRAYPKAKLVALRPFVGAQEAPIKAAVVERNAAGDSRVYYLDSAGWYEGPLHPTVTGSAALAEKLVRALEAQVLPHEAVGRA
ncbi:GDSL-type esterase/lipase family protein [Armatimonas rosea]|uniref:Lysophospholipase L1-like esterase n=1 Tax=Armatimonas rosea TaxID=685828 RepID=A0A7W9SLK2_ARMRO|nr:GDSL-type esterase/lipase family protein [Armatimonas rosea]MBB6048882.1 lysophospholipase L1-like esterase [Armatimonas rosea]